MLKNARVNNSGVLLIKTTEHFINLQGNGFLLKFVTPLCKHIFYGRFFTFTI